MRRSSAMMNAAGPRTGGESTAPIPPADRIAPDDSRSSPAFFSIGNAIAPSVTVGAAPDPDHGPGREAARLTARHAPAGRPAAWRTTTIAMTPNTKSVGVGLFAR